MHVIYDFGLWWLHVIYDYGYDGYVWFMILIYNGFVLS